MGNKTEILTLPCGTKIVPVITGQFYEIYRDGDNFIDYKILDHDFVELFDELLEKAISDNTFYNINLDVYKWDDVKGWC